MGVERFADYYLNGQDGWRESEKDGRRREMPQHRSFEISASDGLNIELSIDRRIQDFVEAELARISSEFEPLVRIIVSDPKSGYILALGNALILIPINLTGDLAHQETVHFLICMSRVQPSKSWLLAVR